MTSWATEADVKRARYSQRTWGRGTEFEADVLQNIKQNPDNLVLTSLMRPVANQITWSLLQKYNYGNEQVLGYKCFLKVRIVKTGRQYIFGVDESFLLHEVTNGRQTIAKEMKIIPEPTIDLITGLPENQIFLEIYGSAGFHNGSNRQCLRIMLINTMLAREGKDLLLEDRLTRDYVDYLKEAISGCYWGLAVRCDFSICGDETNKGIVYGFPINKAGVVKGVKIATWVHRNNQKGERDE